MVAHMYLRTLACSITVHVLVYILQEFKKGLHLRKRGRMNLDLQSHPLVPPQLKSSPEPSVHSQD